MHCVGDMSNFTNILYYGLLASLTGGYLPVRIKNVWLSLFHLVLFLGFLAFPLVVFFVSGCGLCTTVWKYLYYNYNYWLSLSVLSKGWELFNSVHVLCGKAIPNIGIVIIVFYNSPTPVLLIRKLCVCDHNTTFLVVGYHACLTGCTQYLDRLAGV